MAKIILSFSDAPVKKPLPANEEYTLRIKKAEVAPTKDGTSQNLNVEFIVQDVPDEYTVWKTFNLKPQSLWNLRNFLNVLAGGEQYSDEDVEFDPDELVGQEIGAILVTNVYEGKESSVPDTFFQV